MKYEWFKTRGYRHFDSAVGERFARRVCDAAFVQQHSWAPLIHYVKRMKRYKPLKHRTEYKPRDIMYASHRDACILSKYSYELDSLLEEFYITSGLNDNVIAYRKLGRSNYDFSAFAARTANEMMPCVVLCFDISGFFDNLDHAILKNRIKRILEVNELSRDWFNVFRSVTKYSKVEIENIKSHPEIGQKFKERSRRPIATVAEIKNSNIPIYENLSGHGIPQGTPISSTFSNLYMIDVDYEMRKICIDRDALYQRYSDDILIVCKQEDKEYIVSKFKESVQAHKLELKDEKCNIVMFMNGSRDNFQYLGFDISPSGAYIRASSLSRQWRRAKRRISRTQRVGKTAISDGKASKIYTKKLRRILSPVGVRNFSSYARRAATAFESKKILRQVLRLERMADKAIRTIDDDNLIFNSHQSKLPQSDPSAPP